MRRAAIVAHPSRTGVAEALREIAGGLRERGWEVTADPAPTGALDRSVQPLEWENLEADLVLTLGGDGTLLYAARRLAGRPFPIFGVNLGGLGFLTAASPRTLWSRLEPALEGRAPFESRMTLSAEIVRDGEVRFRQHALNDAVIHKGGALRTLRLRIEIASEDLGAYLADGLIVSTPTGATGYNLSAAGPLAVPDLDLLLLTPICAHTLAIRPIVTSPDRRIDVQIEQGGQEMFLVLDGQVEEPLARGDVVRVRRGDHRVSLVGIEPGAYFQKLREKLLWGGRAQ